MVGDISGRGGIKMASASTPQGEITPIDSVQTPATGVKNGVKQSKPKIWKVKRSKAHHKLQKVKSHAQLKVNRIPNLIKARYHIL